MAVAVPSPAGTSGPSARHAIVLAAGRGTRLGELTDQTPKCLVSVDGTTVLDHALTRLEWAGIRQATVVVGYRATQVEEAVARRDRSVRVSFVRNDAYARTGTAESLRRALANMDEDVLVLEGDVLFDRSVLHGLLTAPYDDATAVERWSSVHSGTSVTIDGHGIVMSWVHERDRPASFRLEDSFKTINLHCFSRAFVSRWLRPALAAQVDRRVDASLELALADVVRSGATVHAIESEGRWVEIDDEHDLARARTLFARAPEACL